MNETIMLELTQLKSFIIELQNENKELKNKYNQLEIKCEELSNKKNEIYYQKFLERKLSATHKKTNHGITDDYIFPFLYLYV